MDVPLERRKIIKFGGKFQSLEVKVKKLSPHYLSLVFSNFFFIVTVCQELGRKFAIEALNLTNSPNPTQSIPTATRKAMQIVVEYLT